MEEVVLAQHCVSESVLAGLDDDRLDLAVELDFLRSGLDYSELDGIKLSKNALQALLLDRISTLV